MTPNSIEINCLDCGKEFVTNEPTYKVCPSCEQKRKNDFAGIKDRTDKAHKAFVQNSQTHRKERKSAEILRELEEDGKSAASGE